MGQSGLFFVYFCPFLITISKIQIVKSIDGVLGIRTQGRTMVGVDETTELWRPPESYLFPNKKAYNSLRFEQSNFECVYFSLLVTYTYLRVGL